MCVCVCVCVYVCMCVSLVRALPCVSEIKIQPELNSKLIPPHYRGEVANSGGGGSGGGSSAVDSAEGAAAAPVNDN